MCDTFFWNVRGINEVSKHRPLANWISSKPVSFGALLETHVREPSINHILSTIAPNWSCIANYDHSDLGKIWIIYKSPTKVRLLFEDLQSITVEVTLDSGESFIYTAVYASNDYDTRKELWISLRDTFSSFNLSSRPWMVIGDFNEILSPTETSNPAIFRTTLAMRNFGDCLAEVGLFDLPFQGPAFTWTNHQPSSPIGKKLDRCLVNGNWLLKFPTSHCSFEAPLFSDHTPCAINLITKPPDYGTRPFRFYNMMLKHPSFLETLKEAWQQSEDTVSSLSSFCHKLKGMKRPMKTLCKDKYSGIEKKSKGGRG
ncbi:unnamed protein product [Microthlaspi erraticum]|uniref:Endonuclease/exonuclease/phosphatase domain-containing protein n=1 Tax=Microthlaspi erraticum TaxID=1685480 RepID=A0A6D2IUE9_9BRAS|nr:unnamed protein product [Microthlaspi erraticum]